MSMCDWSSLSRLPAHRQRRTGSRQCLWCQLCQLAPQLVKRGTVLGIGHPRCSQQLLVALPRHPLVKIFIGDRFA